MCDGLKIQENAEAQQYPSWDNTVENPVSIEFETVILDQRIDNV